MSPGLSSPPSAAAPPASSPSPPSLVLLVEDDRLSQRLVTKIFSGHEVLVAETAADAMSLLRRHPQIDLAVVDYQLRGENGSAFVAELRRHAFSQDLPVVAYTGSRDREVVMRYAELRVQGFHLKPYRADSLLGELARAHAAGRRERIFEPTEAACRRMKLQPAEYAGLLNSGAAGLEEDVQRVRRLLLSENDPRLQLILREIAQRLPQLGVRIVAPLARQAESELNQGDYHASAQTLAVLDSVAALVRRRALDLLSLGDSIVRSAEPASPRPAAARGPLYSAEALPAYARPILAQPLGILGAHVSGQAHGPVLAEGRLTPAAADWFRHASASPWFESIRRLDQLDEAAPETVAALLAEVPAFEPTMHLILVRTEVVRQHEIAGLGWPGIVHKLGVAKAMNFAAAGAIGRGPASSPLALQGLRVHAITLLLLGFELGRLLRVTHPQRVAAAALVRDIGFWTLVSASPVTAALLLARGAHTGDLAKAEHDFLGGALDVAAARWLHAAGLPALYQDVAADATEHGDSSITLLVVRLAELLATIMFGAEPSAVAACREKLARADHEIWKGLADLGVNPPVEISEVADLVFTLARSAAWVAEEIVNPR